MKEKEKSNVFIKSILVIISYFALPYVIALISKSNLIDIMLYLLYAFILIFLYKQVFISDFKDIKKKLEKVLNAHAYKHSFDICFNGFDKLNSRCFI